MSLLLLLPAVGALALLIAGAQAQRRSQNDDAPPAPPAQPTSRGENFSARPPAQLFQSDCTGSGCHSSPRGLVKNYSAGSLTGFLREHYTNSRESAAALAGFLISSGAAPPERAARPQQPPPAGPVRPPRAVGREEPSEPPPQVGPRAPARRGRQVATPLPESAAPPPPEPAAASPPPKPPPKPQPKQFDIFD